MQNKIKTLLFYVILIMSLGVTNTYAEHTYRTSVVEKILPSVVEVMSERDMEGGSSFSNNESRGDGFQFRNQQPRNPNVPPQQNRQDPKSEPTHMGSGFVVSSEGFIITNAHVINNCFTNCKKITVVFHDETSYDARLVNYDEDSDIALLKIMGTTRSFPFVTWGETPELGQDVIAIGSPMGQSFTITTGIVSSLNRFIPKAASFVPFIQTDTAINPGNSGGPLFNSSGELIGINTMIITAQSQGSIGLGFAIDGDYAQSVINKLYSGEQIVRPYLGIVYRPLTSDDLENFRHGYGVLIEEVIVDSPSFGILMEGDIILKLDDKDVKWRMLASIIKMKDVGEVVKLIILRDGMLVPIDMTLRTK